MPKFFGPNDLKTMKRISKQVVQWVIDTKVLYAKMNISQTTQNFYGQSLHKQFTFPVNIPAMIHHQPPEYLFEYQVTQQQNVTFKFLQSTLQDYNIYPQINDVIVWRQQMWQITSITNEQLVAGRTDVVWSWVCQSAQVSPTKYPQLAQYVGSFDLIDRDTQQIQQG